MDALVRDVKQAFRRLLAHRGFAAATLITIAVGVGGTAAVFSVVYGVLIRPLPYPEPQQLVRLWEVHPGANAPLSTAHLSEPTFRAWSRLQGGSLQEIAGFGVRDYTVRVGGATQRLRGTRVTPSLFRVLRVSPALGRVFIEADADPGAPPVVILAYGTWQEQFGGDPSAIGKRLSVENVDHHIVGIAPAGFSFPSHKAGWSDSPRDITHYLPLAVSSMEPGSKVIGIIEAIARLKPAATIAQAEGEGTALARSVGRPSAELVFGSGGPVEVRVRSILDQMTTRVRPALLMLLAAVGFVLLIACANAANLFLSRASTRTRDLAVRAALGASRRSLLRELLTESVVISLIGGILGMFVGWALIAAVPLLAPLDFPRLKDIHVDVWFLSVAALVAMFVGIVSGMLPAVRGSRIDLDVILRADGARSVGPSGGGIRRLLLVVEAALAVVLLIGATLLARSFISLINVDIGYNPTNVLTADVHVMRAGKTANAKRNSQITISTLERLRAMPEVHAAGAGTMVPLGGFLSSVTFVLPGLTTDDGRPVVAQALRTIVTPGYAEALGLRLKEGRFFRPEDMTATIQPLLVNETFAKTYLQDGRPITGRRFVGMFPRMLGRNDAVFDVIGVVGDVLPRADAQPQPEIYVAHGTAFDMGSAALVVKTTGDAAAVAAALRVIVREVEPAATVDRVGPLTDKLASSIGEPRFAASVFIAFSVLALVLATTGLYGALSYYVAQRRREIGVRAALGATQGDLVTMVLREGLAVTLTGLVVGMAAATVGTQVMRSLLFGVTPWDRIAFSVGPLLLLGVASAACLIPARRASRIDPLVALRYE